MESQVKIIRNAIKCKNCGEVVESKSRHDWECCKCFEESNGKTGVFCDGGLSYLRWGGTPGTYEDLSETRPYTDEEQAAYEKKIQKQKEFLFWGYDD